MNKINTKWYSHPHVKSAHSAFWAVCSRQTFLRMTKIALKLESISIPISIHTKNLGQERGGNQEAGDPDHGRSWDEDSWDEDSIEN